MHQAQWLVVCTLLAWAGNSLVEVKPARAQEPTAEAVESARLRHVAGAEAVEAGDFSTAETEFRAALALAPRNSTAYNLALVLDEQAKFSEATRIYEELLNANDDDLPDPRAEIEAVLERARARQPQIQIQISGARQAQVSVDGELRGTLARGATLTLPLDPGQHRVSAEDGGERVEDSLTLQISDRRPVRLVLPIPSTQLSPPIPRGLDDGEEAPDPGANLIAPRDEPLDSDEGPGAGLWIGLGLGAAAVTGLLLFLLLPADEGFHEAPIPSFETLRSPHF